MTGLSQRSDLHERMDDPAVPADIYARCLADLAAVNRLTLTHRPTLAWLARITSGRDPRRPVRILDVACGAGDLLRAIHAWAGQRGLPVVLAGIDLNPRSAAVAERLTPSGSGIAYRTGNVFDFDPDPAPDLIVTSQFTHHLADPEVVKLLQWLDAHALDGWHIADLHRHPVAYWGFGLLASLAGWHAIVRHDGMVSVARGFTRREWRDLLAQAAVAAEVRWHPGFRWSVAGGKKKGGPDGPPWQQEGEES